MRKKKKHSKTQDLILLKDALSNYEQGDYESCKMALKQIPFRSVYKDYSSIIKGLILIATDQVAAGLQLFNKIPDDSPYKQLAKVISLSANSIESLIFSKLNSYELALVASLKGWNKKQINIITIVNNAIKQKNNKTLLDIVIKNWQFFGKEKSSQFCLALLPHYPRGIKVYEREFGSLSSFEKNRIFAIRSEQIGDIDEAYEYWRKCIKYLEKEQNSELKIAFIYRHLVDLADNKENIITDLEASLLYDPADKNTYLKLAKWYEDEGELKPYHKWVDTALKHLPKDPDILLLGITSATRKKAFKKAVKFAQTLLKIDPINVKARDCAVASHISHARKLIKTKKYTLASKELEKVNKPNDIVQINQALLAIHTSDNQATAIKMLEKDGICDRFRIIVESKRQFLDLKLTKQNLTPNKTDALKLLNIINAYLAEKVDCLSESVEEIKPTIIKMAKLDFSEDEMLSLCECFKNLVNYDLLGKFTTAANKRWSNHPAFMFYQVYAEINGKIFNLEPYQFQIIDEAMSIANNQGDKRTAMMIINFMRNFNHDNSL
jgi:tetratricopeptide (TPR) repeat protein